MGRVKSLEEATHLKQMGYLIFPNPEDPQVIKAYESGIGPTFEKVGKLPMWNESYLIERVKNLKILGAKRVCFKTGPYDSWDLIEILRIASLAGVDLVTFDGAGGGTGNSPVKMMNEWGIPTVQLEAMVFEISSGAIGVYSYIERISTGLRQMTALNRKFNLKEITREDVVALTEEAALITGLDTHAERLKKVLIQVNQNNSNLEG